MAILKSTSLPDSAIVTNEDMNKALQKKLYEERVNLAANLVIDIEALCHDCFSNGLNQIDHYIIHRCKQLLGETLNSLGLFNVSLYTDVETAISDAIKKTENQEREARALIVAEALRHGINAPPEPSQPANRFVHLNKYPRVKLIFNPRGKTSFDEPDADLQANNDMVAKTVDEINQVVKGTDPSSGNYVRRKYTKCEDGYLIKISFSDLKKPNEVVERISSFIKTLESLSLDELMISQQFSNWFQVEQANPFDLEVSGYANYEQSIAISVFNLGEFTASFYVSTILTNLNILLTNKLKDSDKLSLLIQKESINNSFLCINLEY